MSVHFLGVCLIDVQARLLTSLYLFCPFYGRDFPGGAGESRFVGRATLEDITHFDGRRILGFEPFEYSSFVNEGERKAIASANEILGF